MSSARRDPLVGDIVDGRYRVVERLARGGMSTVYLAVDERLDRQVALKVMHPHLAEDPVLVGRFEQEAKTAARPKAIDGDPAHVGAPMPGVVASVAASAGSKVRQGDLLLTIEAMKMEASISATKDGVVERVAIGQATKVEGGDLIAVIN